MKKLILTIAIALSLLLVSCETTRIGHNGAYRPKIHTKNVTNGSCSTGFTFGQWLGIIGMVGGGAGLMIIGANQ